MGVCGYVLCFCQKELVSCMTDDNATFKACFKCFRNTNAEQLVYRFLLFGQFYRQIRDEKFALSWTPTMREIQIMPATMATGKKKNLLQDIM